MRPGPRYAQPMHTPDTNPAATLRRAIDAASEGLVGRRVLLELVALAAVAREHLLIIGPPGTAKSAAVRRIASTMGVRPFEYLLGRFTEPSELFGPVDLRRLREGEVVTDTTGMLPEAEFVFLDEVFQGSTAILNTLLGLLNERRFRRGHTNLSVPLRLCVGASNALPDDDALAAFADRFLLHVFVEPTHDAHLETLLGAGWALRSGDEPVGSLATIDALSARASAMRLTEVRGPLAAALRALRAAGVVLSDRRMVRSQALIAAAAAIAGREEPTPADLWPLLYVVPSAEAQEAARDTLRDHLASAENATLSAAAEAASASPVARAARLLAAAEALLGAPSGPPREHTPEAAEALLREIDASLAPSDQPEALRAARSRLTTLLGPG